MSMMSYSTVVFTAITIFVVVVSLPCVVMASGGENAEAGGSSDYLYYLLVNQFLYDLTRTAGTAPDIATVRLWIRQIGDHLGCVFSYTDRLGKVLVKRANHLKDKMKNLSGVRKFRGEFTFWKMIECKSRNILAVIVVTVVTATAT